MANQPTKYKKFVATAATATLVASAIVPVASAETKTFPDVPADDQYSVAKAVELGLMNGYANGNFGYTDSVKRSQVVLVMGRLLEQAGVTADADYATNKAFSDVSSDELLKYGNIVKKAGVFTGYTDGTLKPNDNINRENLAAVLDRAAKAIAGVSLVELAESIQDKTVADLSTALTANQAAIQALRDLEISTVENFNPKGDIQRRHFAKFAVTAIEVIESSIPTAEDIQKALDEAKKVVAELPSVVSVTKENAAEAQLKADAAQKAIDSVKAQLNVAEDKLSEEQKSNFESQISAAQSAIDAVKEAIAKATAPVSGIVVNNIKQLNAKQIEIEFSTALDEAVAVSTSNYIVEVTGNTQSYTVKFDNNNPTKVILETSVGITNSEAVKVTVKKDLVAANLTKLAEDKIVTFVSADLVAPEVTSIEKVANDVVIKFNEPINAINLVKFNSYTISNYTIVGNVLTLTGAAANLPAGEYDVVLVGAEDLTPTNPNVSGLYTNKLTVVADTLKPAVTSVTQAADNEITVKFNKAVNPITDGVDSTGGTDQITVTKNGYALKATKVGVNSSKTEYTYKIEDYSVIKLYGDNETSANVNVKVNGFKDGKNTLADIVTQSITLTKDIKAPVAVQGLSKVTNAGSSTPNEVIDVTFDEKIALGANFGASDIVLTDKNGIRKAATSVVVVNDINGDAKVLRIASSAITTSGLIDAGEYTVTLPAGFVVDTSVSQNKSVATSVKVTKSGTSDKIAATVSAANNIITVSYASPMAASAAMTSNYLLDGKELPAGSIAYFNNDNKTVVIEIPKSSVKVSGGGALTIKDSVAGLNGATVNNKLITFTSGLVDGVAPELTSAKKASATTVELTFNENVQLPATTANALDDFIVTINGIQVAPSSIALGSAANKVVLTLPNYDTTQEVKVTTNTASATVTIDVTDIDSNKLKSGTTVVAQ